MFSLFFFCGFEAMYAQSSHEVLFEAVSSTTPRELELSELLNQIRKSGDTDLSHFSFSKRVRAYLQGFIHRDVDQEHTDALALINNIDGYLQRQYKRETALLESALKSLPLSVNAKNKEGLTPLHLAVVNNKPNDIIVPLMASGADIYAVDNKGRTPEHYAALQCAIDSKLGVTLPVGNAEYTWGIRAFPRSCWVQRALATERRQRQGGLMRLYDWLERARHYLPEMSTDEVAEAILEQWQDS